MVNKYYRKKDVQEMANTITIHPSIKNHKLKEWLLIMPNFDNYMINNKKKLKKKIRGGIPDSLSSVI